MGEVNGLSPTAEGSLTAPESQTQATFQLPEQYQGMSTDEIAQVLDKKSWYEQQVQELEPLRQLNEQLRDYGGVDSLVQSYGQIWQQYQQLLQQQQQGLTNDPAGQQGHQNMPTDPTQGLFDENWDYMTPRQQAEKLQQHITNQVMQQAMTALQQNGNTLYQQAYQQLQQENASLRREFDVFRRVLERQRTHPDEDIKAVLEDAARIPQGSPEDWMELAAMRRDYESGASAEKQAKELFEKWKAEEELKRQNEMIGASINSPGGQSFASYFPDSSDNSMEPASVHQRVLERVLKDPASGITSAHIG